MKYLLFFISICLASPVNLRTVTDGRVIKPSEVNQYYSALTGKILPRGSNGVVSDLAGVLGSSTYRWDDGWFSKIYFGDSSSNTYIDSSATELRCFVGGVQKCSMTSSAFDGAYFATGSVSNVAMNNGNYAVSSSDSGTYSTSQTTYAAAVTNATASVTTNGRPVKVEIINPSASDTCYFRGDYVAGGTFYLMIKRDSTQVYETAFYSLATSAYHPCGAIHFIEQPGEGGPYVYTLWVKVSNGSDTIYAQDVKLVVWEI